MGTVAGRPSTSRAVSRLFAVTLAVLLAAALLAPSPARAGGGDGADRFIVTTDPGQAPSERELRAHGAEDVQSLAHTPDVVVVVASPRAAARLAEVRGVTAVERDRTMRVQHHRPDHCGGPAHQQPDHCRDDRDAEEPAPDPTGDQTTPWGVARIGAPDAWTTTSGAGADVCVADTGIDRAHESLSHTAGRNFHTTHPRGHIDRDAYGDGNGHGTHVAGTVAARDNGVGVVGVAPDAGLYVARVLGDNGTGRISQIVDGLNWCADVGADVINMSFAGGHSATLQDAVTKLAAREVVLVASSGNQGADTPAFPAGYPEVIAVGATDEHDAVAGFSNRGEELNAPGVEVLSTVPGNGYAPGSGTSMASPHVAGVAAMLVAQGVADVRVALTDTAESVGAGHLLLDAAAAVGN